MAKVPFSKLALKVNNEIKTVTIGGFDIEVRQYLPVGEKLNLISDVINQAADENNFSNPIKLEVFGSLEIIFNYTNLSFTEKQKEDLVKLYDILNSNGVIDAVCEVIPETEYNEIIDGIQLCSDAIYTYRNSLYGILDTVTQDYSQMQFDATSIQQKLADPQNMELLKSVLTKLG